MLEELGGGVLVPACAPRDTQNEKKTIQTGESKETKPATMTMTFKKYLGGFDNERHHGRRHALVTVRFSVRLYRCVGQTRETDKSSVL